MNLDRARNFLLSLPDAEETMQWGETLVFWAGDKAIGGRMFGMFPLRPGRLIGSFPAGPERYHSMLEIEGLVPAPYEAKNFWVAAERWDVFRDAEWQAELRAGYDYIRTKLPPKTQRVLELPPAEKTKLIRERKALLDAKAKG